MRRSHGSRRVVSSRPLARSSALLLLLLAAPACGDGPGSPPRDRVEPAKVVALTGNGQQATVRTTAGSPLVVSVLDARGEPIAGASVRFAVTAGDGDVSPRVATTNRDGLASATVTLGSTAGDQTIEASVGELPVATFYVTAVAAAATRVTVLSGDAQTGAAGGALGDIVVRVVDAHGNGVNGVPVTATADAGNGFITFATPATVWDGRISASWRIGTTPGAQRATVTVTAPSGIAPLVLTAVAVAGPADTISVAGGNAQVGGAGAPLATPIAAVVVDAYGNPVANHQFAFSVVSGGGSVSPATVTTDANGRASAIWTLGPTLGAQEAQASFIILGQGSGTRPRPEIVRAASFTATATAP